MKRWYDDACGTAFAMELIGERWALLVVRELMFGPRRFGDLRASLNGISANVLTQRLAGLEQAGIVIRRKLPPPASVRVYELTPWGYESEEAIKALGRWAVRSPTHDPTLPLSAASLMLSFRTMYAGGIEALIGFRLEEEGFIARATRDEIAIRRDEPEAADVTFSGSPIAVASVVYGGRPIGEAQASGDLRLEGRHELAGDFVKRFPLPPRIDRP
ncbi:winged helix-turn-helix transcriptional regulator [Paracoccus methylarcula]|uniref:winged helix-turn-helix transcriptional regulator n=1 Tax=Paracoccus methylarcula TaxID=72022 RepID=UPI001FECB17B|nr:helix-turn-helix domain-containing protein [Paracoccus methylarcula]